MFEVLRAKGGTGGVEGERQTESDIETIKAYSDSSSNLILFSLFLISIGHFKEQKDKTSKTRAETS